MPPFPELFSRLFLYSFAWNESGQFWLSPKINTKNRQAKIILYQAFSSTFCTLILYSNAIVSLLFHILLCSCIQMLFHRNVFQNDQESLRWNRNNNISYKPTFKVLCKYCITFFTFCVFFVRKISWSRSTLPYVLR